MQSKLSNSPIKKSTEINEGFPDFFFFTIPLDLSDNITVSTETKSKECNIDLTDNFGLNFMYNDFIISQDDIQTKKSSKSISIISSFNQSSEDNDSIKDKNYKKDIQYLSKKEEKGKKEDNCNIIEKCMNLINCKDYSLQPNYNLNIYNPHINCVNVSYSTFSPSPNSTFSYNNNLGIIENYFDLDEQRILNGNLPLNIYYENKKNINNKKININFNKNDNNSFFINNSFSNLRDNFPINYSNFESNLISNKNNNIKNKKENDKNIKNSNVNTNQNAKKIKKKKKKKIEDEYTVEMFGRRGWICEGCNNFNYESRKNCNRCKVPKKPLKKDLMIDNKACKNINNMMNVINFNHKDDWNCYNCGNINYAFRLNCNRCQMKRDNSLLNGN